MISLTLLEEGVGGVDLLVGLVVLFLIGFACILVIDISTRR